jgi:hypothetical protein
MDSTPQSTLKPQRPLWLRIVRALVFVLAGMATLILLTYTIENWRGTRKWQAYKQQLEAQGEKLNIESLYPPPVPDDKNFARHPLIANLFVPSKALEDPLRNYRTPKLPTPSAPDFEHEKNASGPSRKKNDPRSLLEIWSDYYVGHTNFPQAPPGSSPALVVKTALGTYDGAISELKAAMVARPQCRFPINYQDGLMALNLDYLGAMKSLALTLRLRITANLQLGDSATAFEELKLGCFITDTTTNDPILIAYLVHLATDMIMLDAVKDGLELRRWNDAQLTWIGQRLAQRDYLGAYQKCMRGERNFTLLAAEMLRGGRVREMMGNDPDAASTSESLAAHAMPSGWVCQNMYHLARFFQDYALTAVDVKQRRVLKEKVNEFDPAIKNAGFLPYTILVKMLVPALSKSTLNFARWQSVSDCTAIACALERHRLAAGKLPENLEVLVPKYLPALPRDVVTGAPLTYRVVSADYYQVYSFGWNEKDDGGAADVRREKGDWGVEIKAPGR